MWFYEKQLQYPVKIKNPNPKLASVIISQLGGPDGELGASMRYLHQRYSCPYDKVTGISLMQVSHRCAKLAIGAAQLRYYYACKLWAWIFYFYGVLELLFIKPHISILSFYTFASYSHGHGPLVHTQSLPSTCIADIGIPAFESAFTKASLSFFSSA